VAHPVYKVALGKHPAFQVKLHARDTVASAIRATVPIAAPTLALKAPATVILARLPETCLLPRGVGLLLDTIELQRELRDLLAHLCHNRGFLLLLIFRDVFIECLYQFCIVLLSQMGHEISFFALEFAERTLEFAAGALFEVI
jgi:hypothetical protein